MKEIYRELAAVLRERFAIIADQESRRDAAQHVARLQKVSERIEQQAQQLPRATDPQLRHFLQQRSYSKALEFIEAF